MKERGQRTDDGYRTRTARPYERPENITAFAVALFIGLLRFVTRGRTIWELDECLFALGVERFDPLAHHPHPPGYPMTIALGKLFALLTGDAFTALVAVNVLGSAIGAAALTIAFSRMSGSLAAGAAGALLFHLSPVMLVHGPLALSDGPALAFLSLAILAATREGALDAAMLGIWSSFAIGSRPQYVLAIAPALLAVMLLRTRRYSAVLLGGAAVASLSWFVPLLIAVGGPADLFRYEFVQARYVAEHDAEVSRSGWSVLGLVQRFVAHPWGSKFLSLPLLATALLGIAFARKQWKSWAFVVVLSAAQLMVCFSVADPADGVRYVLPASFALAFFAAIGLQKVVRKEIVQPLLALAWGVGAFVYVHPILAARMVAPSPPVAVASALRPVMQKNAVIGYEPALRGHAEFLLRDAQLLSIDAAMLTAIRDNRPLILFVEGRATGAIASAEWPESDAYGKMTRDHYRIVSALSIAPGERYIPLSGVYGLEHIESGERWRWLDREASIELPQLGAQKVELEIGLAGDALLEGNEVRVSAGSVEGPEVAIRRGERKRIVVDLPPGGAIVRFRSTKNVVPAAGDSLNNDPRSLAIQLFGVKQLVPVYRGRPGRPREGER